MRRITHIMPLLMAAAIGAACEDGPPWTPGDSTAPAEARADFGRTATYARRLLFIGPGAQLPTAAIFDYTTLSDSTSVRRGVRARVLVDGEWQAPVDAGLELEPMRMPWRILPMADLRVVVNDAGEIGALAYRGDPAVRLEPGARFAETSPDNGTRLVLRQAALHVDDQTVRGILLDAQIGRSVDPASMPPAFGTDDDGADTAGEANADAADTSASDTESSGTAADGGANGSVDPIPGRPTPLARPGTEGFLVNNSGYYAAFTTAAQGRIAWISQSGADEIRSGGVLQPAAWPPGQEGGAGEEGSAAGSDDDAGDADALAAPTAWRIVAADGELTGELTTEVSDVASLADLELTSLGYTLVSGWIEDRGVRRDVFGLIRHVR